MSDHGGGAPRLASAMTTCAVLRPRALEAVPERGPERVVLARPHRCYLARGRMIISWPVLAISSPDALKRVAAPTARPYPLHGLLLR